MLNTLTVMLALTCAGLVVFWVRSYGMHDFIGLQLGPVRVFAYSGEGWPSLNVAHDVAKVPINDGWQSDARRETAEQWSAGFDPHPNHYGFGLSVRRTAGPGDAYWLHGNRLLVAAWMPYWSLVALTAMLPVVRGFRMVRRRRNARPVGHCRVCDYDLRGNVSGVCPECGSRVQMTAPAGAHAEPKN
jgi:hypothetical protein